MKLREKTTAILLVVLLTSMAFGIAPILAAKPSDKLMGAEKVAWHLSADVMPVPPYGSHDIVGSDDASKLIVNQPNGAVEVVITGAMNGLNPDTIYTVFLSKGYEPYVGWNIEGIWILRIIYGANYDHDIVINVQTDGTFTGTGGYPAGSPLYGITEIVTGTIDVISGAVFIRSEYEGSNYWYEATGTIASDGSMMSGTWTSSSNQFGNWLTISGSARTPTGDTGWSGLFTSTIPAFTFRTDIEGAGSWHLNLRDDDFLGPGTHTLSVWINVGGGTLLISDNFEVVSD